MVSIKAESQNAPKKAAPPYPLSPGEERASFMPPTSVAPGAVQTPKPSSSKISDDDLDDWEKDDPEDEEWQIEDKPTELPDPLKAGKSQEKAPSKDAIPQSLRPGPPSGSANRPIANPSQISLPASSAYPSSISLPHANSISPPHASSASLPYASSVSLPRDTPPPLPNQNPYLVQQTTGERLFGSEKNSAAWGTPVHSSPNVVYSDDPMGPVELPAVPRTPTEEVSRMNINLPASPQSSQPPLIPVEPQTPARGGRQDSQASSAWDPGMDLSSFDASARAHGIPEGSAMSPGHTWEEQQAWDQAERVRRQREAHLAAEAAREEEQLRKAEEEWHAGEAAYQATQAAGGPSTTRPISGEVPPPKPPRTEAAQSSLARSTQRNNGPEHYQIKNIRWYDASCSKLRTSPILTQNDNGPCPLLALVNCLVLSTPEDETTGLVDTLRTREQVSLNLLLDAVFDELMSGRRRATEELPDVGELYAFLLTLDTGMNVNPRYTFKPDRSSMEIHPLLRPTNAPGGFEETKEMRLYSAFDVPLVHAWLPGRESPAYEAFNRSAKTYEDAQNILFGEEELEHKLNTSGLTPQEQQLFEDLHTIKSFLETWPTQLTDYGLHVLHEHLKPGSFSILFRNDHFSTVYKEPKAHQLLTLVTDAGYSSHDEIIWESLVDVTGQGSELFSGDFRPVSHNASTSGTEAGPSVGPRSSSLGGQQIRSMLDVGDESEWSTVPNRRGNRTSNRPQSQGTPASQNNFEALAAPRPFDEPDEVERSMQEDHDLALALQLQEEEEANARRESEQRQREERLSRQLLDGQGRPNAGSRVNIPVTSGNARPPAQPPRPQPQPQGLRPLPPPRRNREDEEPAPPTYEEASVRPAFVPPSDHPASPSAPLPSQGGGRGRGRGNSQSSYAMQTTLPPGAPGRAHGTVNVTEDREKCVVM